MKIKKVLISFLIASTVFSTTAVNFAATDNTTKRTIQKLPQGKPPNGNLPKNRPSIDKNAVSVKTTGIIKQSTLKLRGRKAYMLVVGSSKYLLMYRKNDLGKYAGKKVTISGKKVKTFNKGAAKYLKYSIMIEKIS